MRLFTSSFKSGLRFESLRTVQPRFPLTATLALGVMLALEALVPVFGEGLALEAGGFAGGAELLLHRLSPLGGGGGDGHLDVALEIVRNDLVSKIKTDVEILTGLLKQPGIAENKEPEPSL